MTERETQNLNDNQTSLKEYHFETENNVASEKEIPQALCNTHRHKHTCIYIYKKHM